MSNNFEEPTEDFFEIPEKEYKIFAVRSSGKGGQNVNKVSTKAKLTWNLFESTSFTEDEKARIMQKLGEKITKDGNIMISSQEQRSLEQNKIIVTNKLNETISQALVIPKERIPTNPTWSSKEKRIEEKKKESHKKQLRKSIKEW